MNLALSLWAQTAEDEHADLPTRLDSEVIQVQYNRSSRAVTDRC